LSSAYCGFSKVADRKRAIQFVVVLFNAAARYRAVREAVQRAT
jgi:hypothetical protein